MIDEPSTRRGKQRVLVLAAIGVTCALVLGIARCAVRSGALTIPSAPTGIEPGGEASERDPAARREDVATDRVDAPSPAIATPRRDVAALLAAVSPQGLRSTTSGLHSALDSWKVRALARAVIENGITASELRAALESEHVPEDARASLLLAFAFAQGVGDAECRLVAAEARSLLGELDQDRSHPLPATRAAFAALALLERSDLLAELAPPVAARAVEFDPRSAGGKGGEALTALGDLLLLGAVPPADAATLLAPFRTIEHGFRATYWAGVARRGGSVVLGDVLAECDAGNGAARHGLERFTDPACIGDLASLAARGHESVYHGHLASSAARGLLSIGTRESVAALVALIGSERATSTLLGAVSPGWVGHEPRAAAECLRAAPGLDDLDYGESRAALRGYAERALERVHEYCVPAATRAAVLGDVREVLAELAGDSPELRMAIEFLARNGGPEDVALLEREVLRLGDRAECLERIAALRAGKVE